MSKPLRVAVVDDSSFVRRAIDRMFRGDPEVEIVGLAASGEELLTNLDAWRPDVITLDLSMPGMGGLPTLDRIMAHRPTAVIILSTHSAKDAPMTIEALHRGAVDFIDKQRYSLVDFESLRSVIVEKLRHVTTGHLIQRRRPVSAPPPPPRATPSNGSAKAGSQTPEPGGRRGGTATGEAAKASSGASPLRATDRPAARVERKAGRRLRPSSRFDALLIGASTGGPPTIQRLLEDLGDEVPVPVVIVQHMPMGFTRAFAERLNSHLPLHVREAEDAEVLLPSTVYIAPAGMHLRLKRRGEDLLGVLGYEPDDLTHRPSVDVMFTSAAEVLGKRALAVLLTGMGSDGAQGLATLKALGGYTMVQDQESCVVYGMPRTAVLLKAHKEQVALDQMGARLGALFDAFP